MAVVEQPSGTSQSQPSWCHFARRRWAVWVAALLLLLAAVFHAPLARGLAEMLIAHQPVDEPAAIVWLPHALMNPEQYDFTVECYQQHRDIRIFIMQEYPSRTVRLGICKPPEEFVIEQLVAKGVSRKNIEVVPGEVINSREAFQTLERHLGQLPERLVVPVSRFDSARLRQIADDALSPAASERVAILALPGLEFDETNWWKSRRGFKQIGHAWFYRLHYYVYGNTEPRWNEWDPDQYVRDLADKQP